MLIFEYESAKLISRLISVHAQLKVFCFVLFFPTFTNSQHCSAGVRIISTRKHLLSHLASSPLCTHSPRQPGTPRGTSLVPLLPH